MSAAGPGRESAWAEGAVWLFLAGLGKPSHQDADWGCSSRESKGLEQRLLVRLREQQGGPGAEHEGEDEVGGGEPSAHRGGFPLCSECVGRPQGA